MDEASKVQIDAAVAFNEIVTNSGKTNIFRDPSEQIVALNILERHFAGGNRFDLTPFEDVRDLIDRYEERTIDPVMGIPNRRAFEGELLRRWARFVRNPNKNSFALAMIDIDNFKYLNDEYGHSTGDEVLKMVADAFKDNLRVSDFVARWGGDEMAVIIDNDQAEGGKISQEAWESKLRLVNEQINEYMSERGRQWPGLQEEGQVTHFSTGVYVLSERDVQLDRQELVKLADNKAGDDKRTRNVKRGKV